MKKPLPLESFSPRASYVTIATTEGFTLRTNSGKYSSCARMCVAHASKSRRVKQKLLARLINQNTARQKSASQFDGSQMTNMTSHIWNPTSEIPRLKFRI
jgi:hypothetical protein